MDDGQCTLTNTRRRTGESFVPLDDCKAPGVLFGRMPLSVSCHSFRPERLQFEASAILGCFLTGNRHG